MKRKETCEEEVAECRRLLRGRERKGSISFGKKTLHEGGEQKKKKKERRKEKKEKRRKQKLDTTLARRPWVSSSAARRSECMRVLVAQSSCVDRLIHSQRREEQRNR